MDDKILAEPKFWGAIGAFFAAVLAFFKFRNSPRRSVFRNGNYERLCRIEEHMRELREVEIPDIRKRLLRIERHCEID